MKHKVLYAIVLITLMCSCSKKDPIAPVLSPPAPVKSSTFERTFVYLDNGLVLKAAYHTAATASIAFRLSETALNIYISDNATGLLKIAKCDPALKIISGSFNYTLASNKDPLSANITSTKATAITLKGSFNNLVVFPVEKLSNC